MDNMQSILDQASAAVSAASNLQELDQVRVEYLGKKGPLTALRKGLGALTPEERPAAGAKINEAIQHVSEQISARKEALENAELEAKLAAETVDVTLPGRGQPVGSLPTSAIKWPKAQRSKTIITTSKR
jgi:phenylalanyl-tRNA synthetase alpha chain